MSFTRKTLADAIDAYDADIEILQQSKRETFTEYREQLAEEGRDRDAVKDEIAAFKAAMKRRRAVAKEGNEAVEDQAALVDEIFVEITAARAPRATRVENIEEFPSEANQVEAQKARLAALRADPAISVVSVDKLKTEPQPATQAVQGGDTHAEPVSSRTNQPETANEAAGTRPVPSMSEQTAPAPVQRFDASNSAKPDDVTRPGEQRPTDIETSAGKSVEAPASAAPAPMYAEPGVVTWERTPPEGVRRHEYSLAFGDLGQDIVVIADDIAGAKAEPIVKIGNEILDGWARYMTARGAVGLDGQSTEYPVVQYDGTDPLMDCIRWNVAGRILNDMQKRTVAQRLSRLEPRRKADIYAEFELGMELA